MNKENMKLNLICKTWNIESFGLYDYHLNIDKQIIELNIENDIEVFRIANKIYTNTYISQGYLGIKGFKNFECKPDLLFTIYKSDSKYFLSNEINFEVNDENMKIFLNKIWICFRQFNTINIKETVIDYILKENSIIRFGRCVFKVNRIKWNKLNSEKKEDFKNNEIDVIYQNNCYHFDSLVVDSSISCRYCYNDINDEDKEENPLVSLCKCKGGSRYIHYKCVKQWMNLKLNVKECQNTKNFYFKSFNCEICKVQYPCKFYL